MEDAGLHVVTGAFGYSGRHIARRLLADGRRVRTLTNSPDRAHEFGDRVDVHPLAFDEAVRLAESLRGCDALYNTYWVRFNHPLFTHEQAVRNTIRLFEAAEAAGVRRVVHVSITNPDEQSPFEYFRGKARLEHVLRDSGISHSILRPAVLFGGNDILLNNIAWTLRRFPVAVVFGDGSYRLRPIHVEDFAALAVARGAAADDEVVDAVGPETFTYRELLATLAKILGLRRPIVRIGRGLGLLSARLIGRIVGDVMLTRDEIDALCADLLWTPGPATGTTRLTDWARENAATLGRRYANELARRKDRVRSYDDL